LQIKVASQAVALAQLELPAFMGLVAFMLGASRLSCLCPLSRYC